MKREIVFGLLVALFLAIIISPFASPWPDGMEKVAEDEGFLEKGEVTLFNSPMPDYIWPGIKSEGVATSIAGAFGTILMFGLTYGLANLLKKR